MPSDLRRSSCVLVHLLYRGYNTGQLPKIGKPHPNVFEIVETFNKEQEVTMAKPAAGAAPPYRQEGHSKRRPVHRKTKDQKSSQPGATDKTESTALYMDSQHSILILEELCFAHNWPRLTQAC